MSKLRNIDVRIEYTGSIIRVHQEGRLGNLLKMLARELEEKQLSMTRNLAVQKRAEPEPQVSISVTETRPMEA